MMMNATATKVWNAVQAKFPNQFEFKRKTLHDVAAELGYGSKHYKDLIADEFKVRKGLYNYASLSSITGTVTEKAATTVNLAKAGDTKKKPAKKHKSARTWKGEAILKDDTAEEKPAQKKSSGFTGYVERDGVGAVYRDGEKVSEINYNNRKSND